MVKESVVNWYDGQSEKVSVLERESFDRLKELDKMDARLDDQFRDALEHRKSAEEGRGLGTGAGKGSTGPANSSRLEGP